MTDFNEKGFNFKGIADPLNAWGRCLWESVGFAQKYGFLLIGVKGYEYSGREHWAVFVEDGDFEDGQVIDLTARQFSLDAPPRYQTDVLTWLDDACEWLGDSVVYEVFKNEEFEGQIHRAGDPIYRGAHIREDIDPDTYKRKYVAYDMVRNASMRS